MNNTGKECSGCLHLEIVSGGGWCHKDEICNKVPQNNMMSCKHDLIPIRTWAHKCLKCNYIEFETPEVPQTVPEANSNSVLADVPNDLEDVLYKGLALCQLAVEDGDNVIMSKEIMIKYTGQVAKIIDKYGLNK